MKPFEYASPTDLHDVAHLAGSRWDEGAILAGGTDLLALMKDEVVAPKRVVNVKNIAHLTGITARIPTASSRSSQSRIGALTRLQDVADNAIVRKNFPALAEAVEEAASPQIRNMATLGGNLCQRPRCWYFRSGFGLLAIDKDGNSLIEKGDHRYHAILGNDGLAKFVSPSTIAPVLIAYNAELVINGGSRAVRADEFYRIPKAEGEREHNLQPGEMVTDIVLPFGDPSTRAAVYEVRQKHAFDWPLATAAVVLQMEGNTVKSARVVMGNVAPIPWISKEAEAALVGMPLNEQTAEAAGAAAVQNARSLGQNGYKIQCARVAVKRAILKAGGLTVV